MFIPLGAKMLGGAAVASAIVAAEAAAEGANTVAWVGFGTAVLATFSSVAIAWINRGVRADVAKAVVKIDEVKQETAVIKQDVNSGASENRESLRRAHELIGEQAATLTEQAAALAHLRTERTERTASDREADVAAREIEVARQEQPPEQQP